MKVERDTLPRKYHDAVVHWQRHWFKDYESLLKNWERYFPREPCFQLCAFRQKGTPDKIEVGEEAGKPKYLKACEMNQEQSQHLLQIIRAQASTEFGSIQQHQETLARAPSDEDRYWIMRVMAEELRHGYQMFHLLLSDDWSSALGERNVDEAVEEALSMTTGSHVLGAFNIDYDSFMDSVVFAAFIDRVGKYQLTMQQICSYKPMADSMPPMLKEEAFHLAAGVVPMRRWMLRVAEGDPTISSEMIQKTVNKWFPRGLEMFGHEKGGGTNVKFGFKDMKNAEAQAQYAEECRRMLEDINARYLRARLPEINQEEAEKALAGLTRRGETFRGVKPEDLLRLPDVRFFRRRGEPAFTMIGHQGETWDDMDAYVRHVVASLPEAYVTTRDFHEYLDLLGQVQRGEIEAQTAARRSPTLKRVGGSCPCSKAVRWVVDEPAGNGDGNGNGNG